MKTAQTRSGAAAGMAERLGQPYERARRPIDSRRRTRRPRLRCMIALAALSVSLSGLAPQSFAADDDDDKPRTGRPSLDLWGTDTDFLGTCLATGGEGMEIYAEEGSMDADRVSCGYTNGDGDEIVIDCGVLVGIVVADSCEMSFNTPASTQPPTTGLPPIGKSGGSGSKGKGAIEPPNSPKPAPMPIPPVSPPPPTEPAGRDPSPLRSPGAPPPPAKVVSTKIAARLGDEHLPLPDLTLRRQGDTLEVIGLGISPSRLGCLKDGGCRFTPVKPKGKGKALLVLLENGGFTTGLPEDFGIDVATCGDFDFMIAPGDDLGDLIGEIADLLASAWQCFNPASWHVEHVDLLPYIAEITDVALETASESFILGSGAPLVYDKVVILQDGDFRTSTIRTKLAELARDYEVDVHVLSHGSEDGVGPSSRVTAQDIRALRTVANLDIRAVYQMNCFGSELNGAWRAAGADVVNGADDINYLSLTYAPYLLRWVAGQTFTSALDGSIDDLRAMYEMVFSYVDFYVDDGSFDEADVRQPPLFSLTGSLSFRDEFDASRGILAGNRSLHQYD